MGGALSAHDFGTLTPTQEDLVEYYCVGIWGGYDYGAGTFTWDAEDPRESTYEIGEVTHTAGEIFNNTWFRNTYQDSNHRFVITNTPDTEPSVFIVTDVGFDTVAQATDVLAGVMKLYTSLGTSTEGEEGEEGEEGTDGTVSQAVLRVLFDEVAAEIDGFTGGLADKLDVQQLKENAGLAVVVDADGKLSFGVAGKVDTVDGLDPEKDTKNVKLTWVYETEKEFEADKGNIPKGARVVKTWEFPDNVSVLPHRPDLWPVATEVDLGGGLYGVVISGVLQDWTLSSGILNYAVGFTVSGWNNSTGRIISFGGGYQKGSDSSWHILGYSRWLTTSSSNMSVVINPGGNVWVNVCMEGCEYDAANANYQVWLTYKKG
jgi:hypothetical protein